MVITSCACMARGEVISFVCLSICLSVYSKIAISPDVGIKKSAKYFQSKMMEKKRPIVASLC